MTLRWACTRNALENESTLVIMIDGRIVFRKPIGGPADLGSGRSHGWNRTRSDHGAFLKDSRAGESRRARRRRGLHRPLPCGVRAKTSQDCSPSADLTGGSAPHRPQDPSCRRRRDRRTVQPHRRFETPSRALIFVCDPKADRRAAPAPGRSRKTWRVARSGGRSRRKM